MKTRILSMMLAAVMSVGMIFGASLAAFAATSETHEHSEYTPITKLSEIKEQGSYYLADGFALNYSDREIKASGTVNLCLNGQNVSCGYATTITSGTTVNICDCSSGKTGTLNCSVTNNGTLNLHGGKIGGQIKNQANAVLNIYGGSITAAGSSDYAIDNNASLLIEGGIFEAKNNVCIDNDGIDATIKGGTFIANGSNSVVRNNGASKMDISGGTFTSKGENKGTVLDVAANSTLTVSGGSFSGGGTTISNRGTTNINGGSFTSTATADNRYVIDTTATINISGGTFSHEGKSVTLFVYQTASEDAPISLSGGTFKSGVGITCYRGNGYGTAYLKDVLASGYSYYQNDEVVVLGPYQSAITDGDVTIAEEPDVEIYTITFDANGGSVSTASAETNQKCQLASLPTPTRDHYTFNGWFTAKEGGTKITVDTVYSSTQTVYAQWSPEVYTITSVLYGDVTDTDTYSYGEDVDLPADAQRDGYRFRGWYKDAECTDGPYGKIKQSSVNFTFHAKWEKEFDVTILAADNGSVSASISKAVEGETVTLTVDPADYHDLVSVFVKDADNAEVPLSGEGYEYTFKMPAKTVVVTAEFAQAQVTFDDNGGTGIMNPITVTDANGTYTLPECGFTAPATDVPGGMAFAGWAYADDGEVIADDPITVIKNTELFAIWKYTPTLEQTIEKSGAFDKQHTFNIDLGALMPPDAKIEQGAGITSSGVAVATTTPSYTIGSNDASLKIVTRVPDAPVSDAVVMTLNTENYGKFTFTVKINLIGYAIEYVLNGGSVASPNPTAYSSESEAFTLVNPTKTGYTFKGWSGTDLNGDENASVTIAKGSTGDRIYTANWMADTYAVILNVDGGTVRKGDVVEYTYGIGATLPTDVAKSGYYFGGWYDNEAFEGDPVTEISATDMGDKTFYAKWTYIPAPIYSPIVEDADGGEVSVSTKYPSAGEKVTVTAVPAVGFEVSGVTVADRDGNPVEVTVNEDGTYGFTQPYGAVSVKVSFALAGSGCQGDDACAITEFSDADASSWYHDGVCWALNGGILRGYDDGLLGPADVTTRAQVFAMLHRLEGEPEAAESTFADVDANAWYAGSIAWAQQTGLALGYGDGTEIGPNDELTREQLATILYRYAHWKGMDTSASADLRAFEDVADVSTYAATALKWAVAEGVIRGYDDGSNELGPKDPATRAQVATMLMRFVAL